MAILRAIFNQTRGRYEFDTEAPVANDLFFDSDLARFFIQMGDGMALKSAIITSDQNWIKPAGVEAVLAIVAAAGGGGGGSLSPTYCAGGGGGGEVRRRLLSFGAAEETIAAVIGQGGVGGTPNPEEISQPNGDSATTTASSENADYLASRMWDGSSGISNMWQNNHTTDPVSGGNVWFQADLGSSKWVKSVRLSPYSLQYMPKDVVVKGSDTGSFSGEETTIGSFTFPNQADSEITFSSNVRYRYFRLFVTSVQGGSPTYAQVGEVAFNVGLELGAAGNGGNTSLGDYLTALGGQGALNISSSTITDIRCGLGGGANRKEIAGSLYLYKPNTGPGGSSGGCGGGYHYGDTAYKNHWDVSAQPCAGFGKGGANGSGLYQYGGGGGGLNDGADAAGDDEDGNDAAGYGGGGSGAGKATTAPRIGGAGAPGRIELYWFE